VLLASVVLHIAGTAKHALVDGNGVLARMGIGRPEPRRQRGGPVES
jgi:cytochrome b561